MDMMVVGLLAAMSFLDTLLVTSITLYTTTATTTTTTTTTIYFN